MTTTCARTHQQTNELTNIERRPSKHLSKRDSVVIVDTYPIEFNGIKKPKVIYRRISKQRYRAPKPKYGPPKPKYGVPKQTAKKPYKKHKSKKVNSKFGPLPSKRPRLPKPSPRPTAPRPTSKYSIPKLPTQHQTYFTDSTWFGEPPQMQMAPKEFEFKKPLQSLYAEPPVDSYGAPLKIAASEPSNLDEEYIDATVSYSNNHELNGGMLSDGNGKYHRWQDFPANQGNNYGYSNKKQAVLMMSKLLSDDEADLYEDTGMNSYPDIFKYNPNNPGNFHDNHKIPINNELIQNSQKYLNKPWKISGVNNQDHDQIVVGGQYAEPPGRYVPKENNPSVYFNEDQIFSGFFKPEIGSSATMSPYVNYKHSNMAFSPQNLNDAFGIVEK